MGNLLFISTIIFLIRPTSLLLGYDVVSEKGDNDLLGNLFNLLLISLMLLSRLAVLILSFIIFGLSLVSVLVILSQLLQLISAKTRLAGEVIVGVVILYVLMF